MRVILDLDATTLVAQFDDANASAESPFQFVDGRFDIRINHRFLLVTRSGAVRSKILNKGLDLSYGKSLRGGFFGNFYLLLGGRQAQNGASVSHGEHMFGQE